jgi:hypothetical protein
LSVTKITDEVIKRQNSKSKFEVGEEHTSDVTAVETSHREISNYLFNNPSA